MDSRHHFQSPRDSDELRVEEAAMAMRAVALGFRDPVDAYVTGEAGHQWEKNNPGKDYLTDGPPIDWALEGWKILARAALKVPPPLRFENCTFR